MSSEMTTDEPCTVTYDTFVNKLMKKPAEIKTQLVEWQIALIHAAMGISGEAGEILDIVKKLSIYNKPLDDSVRNHLVEELGDIEFYLSYLRSRIHVTREQVLLNNMRKLRVRYPDATYTDAHAEARLDKCDQPE